MKKIGQTFITWLLVAFFLVMTVPVPLVMAQQTPFPQPTPLASQSNRVPVVLDNETLFVL